MPPRRRCASHTIQRVVDAQPTPLRHGALLNTDLLFYLAVFAVMSAIIIGAGVLLAKSGDRIADVTGLGGLLIGMVLVAAATSLPEIAVAVSAVVTEGSPDLAIGNLLGSNMANMALLAIVDLVWRGQVWHRVGSGHARTAAVAIALTAVASLAILRPFEIALGWVGLESIIIFVGFVSLIAWTHRSSTPAVPTGEVSHEQVSDHEQISGAQASSRAAILHTIRWDLAKFGAAALVILVSAPILVDAADGIAREAAIGESFVGASFLAFSTSLPELATAIAAVRIGAFDLAVGSLLGSNAFNMAIILIVDLFYLDGPILAAVDPIQAFVGVGAILLMAIVLAGIIHGARTRSSRLEPGSGMALVVYVLLMYMIFSAGV
jgi:cation:H+ antiporter